MKIKDNPGLINDKAIDVLVDVARRTSPNGWKLNEKKAREKCKDVLRREGRCTMLSTVVCPDFCSCDGECYCGMYNPS